MTVRDALVAAALAALFLVCLGRPELLDPDESRHAEIAREMLVEQHFLTPRLDGEAYYDKPVGFHWTVAASLAVLGPSAGAARLPAALAALATLAITAWWAQRLRGPAAGGPAALMLGTTYLFVALGRLATIDMLFTALLTAAVARLSVAADEPSETRRTALASYVLVALATLVKGPVALVLVMPALVVALLVTRGQAARDWLVPWRGVAAILVIAAPWYVAAAYADPVYIRTFLATHNVARFVGSETLPHQSSIVYYALTLPLALMPWTPVLAAGCYSRLRSGGLRRSEKVLLTWLVTVTVVFACARTRLITYLLPAFPSLAVLATAGLADMRRDGPAAERASRRLRAWANLCGTAVAVAVLGATAVTMASVPTRGVTAVALVAAVTYLVAVVASRRPAAPVSAVAILAAGTMTAAIGTYGPVADLLTAARGYRCLAAQLARSFPPDGVVSSLAWAPHALAFYSGRRVGRVSDLEAARAALAGDQPLLLLTKKKYADALTADPESTMETLWRNALGTTLLANARASEEWRRREGVEPSADHDGRHHGFEDRSGHRTRSLSSSSDRAHP